MPFSVIISIYKKDNPAFVRTALESIIAPQEYKPSEIVLVVDGPVSPEMGNVINEFDANYSYLFKIIRLTENKGLGNALRVGVENASNELIARMDSDDISLPDRFSKQVSFLNSHPDVAIVGGQITEFIDQPTCIVGRRVVPQAHEDILSYIRNRCPMNHVSVMFRKSEVQRVGGYLDWPWNEDYYLWVRMAVGGCKFANLPDDLVNVRVGKEMYSRRGGRAYFKSEKGIQQLMLGNRMLSFPRYCWNVIIRFVVQVMVPDSWRGWIFKTFARS